MPCPHASSAACALLGALPLCAQQNVYLFDSLTNWTHQGPNSAWVDDQPEPTADFGIVDYLAAAFDFSYDQTLALPAGNYVARARLRKRVSAVGTQPLDFRVGLGAFSAEVRLDAASQPVDQWIHTPWLNFTVVATTGAVDFALGNFDPALLVLDYEFDSIHIGQYTSIVQSLLYEPLDDWTFVNDPAYVHGVTEGQSVFGANAQLTTATAVSISRSYDLAAGGYYVRARIMKETTNPNDVDDFVVTAAPAGSGTVTSTAWTAVSQTPGSYQMTPWFWFSNGSSGPVVLQIASMTAATKSNYRFDAFQITRSTATASLATGCAQSNGRTPRVELVSASTGWAWINRRLTLQVLDAPAVQPNWFLFGLQALQVDLTVIGMPGCQLGPNPIFTEASMTDAVGQAPFGFDIPNDRDAVGLRLFIQAFTLDPGLNALGLVTSTTRRMEVGT